ncbi:MAG: NUDIX hydrolase [Bacilli bacterium]
MNLYEKTLAETTEYRGNVLSIRKVVVALADGTEATREVLDFPGAVGIIPITASGEIVLVKQFRKAIERVIYEIPAGKLEDGEEPLYCAKRELEEETGLEAHSWTQAGGFYKSPGYTADYIHLFWAEQLQIVENPKAADADERVEVVTVSVEEAHQLEQTGHICDAKTLYALRLYEKKFQR